MARDLLGDRPPLDFVGVEQSGIGPAFDDACQHPGEVHGIGDAGVHAVGGEGNPDMRRVAAQEYAPIAETVGEHPPADPILAAQRFERERRADAKDVADASFAIRRHRRAWRGEFVNDPPLAPVDREDEAAMARIDAVDRPGRTGHHRQQTGRPDDRRLGLQHCGVAIQNGADRAANSGMSAVAAHDILSGDGRRRVPADVDRFGEHFILALLDIVDTLPCRMRKPGVAAAAASSTGSR